MDQLDIIFSQSLSEFTVLADRYDGPFDGISALVSLLSSIIKQGSQSNTISITFVALAKRKAVYEQIVKKLGFPPNSITIIDAHEQSGPEQLLQAVAQELKKSEESVSDSLFPSLRILAVDDAGASCTEILGGVQRAYSTMKRLLSTMRGSNVCTVYRLQPDHIDWQISDGLGVFPNSLGTGSYCDYFLNEATSIVSLENLPSGYSQDVHGRIVFIPGQKLKNVSVQHILCAFNRDGLISGVGGISFGSNRGRNQSHHQDNDEGVGDYIGDVDD